MHFIKVQVVQQYSSIDMAVDWKNSCFISSQRSDFHMVINLSVAVLTLQMHVDITFSRGDIAVKGYEQVY